MKEVNFQRYNGLLRGTVVRVVIPESTGNRFNFWRPFQVQKSRLLTGFSVDQFVKGYCEITPLKVTQKYVKL